MTPGPDLQQLITTIKTDAGSDDELEQLATAAATISELTTTSDAALGFFVDRARGAGKSWVEISAVLGVSKQAAHKRFAAWTSKPAFDRYTERTKAVVAAAADVARERDHTYIGTEHLLLAFYSQPRAVATLVLLAHGITADSVRAAVDLESPAGAESVELDADNPPYTRRTAHVLQGAVGEALTLGHNYVGTEHLLLAFYRDQAGVATKILLEQGLDEATAWNDIRAALERITK
ncbi:Clp protease N-terminal domain-containing protein [Kribbella solani]|uniref:Clp protease N-terminal domain-containing protein n=1 Tax=Kribbella solani TaxID=236067 RepID=UPI0029BE2088|nr:Clp protease N-terminal domain-containing protein [Kribbella solani]MDX3003205.1 Clp protease N-terminal domain-containing protein [Kribbella solani]